MKSNKVINWKELDDIYNMKNTQKDNQNYSNGNNNDISNAECFKNMENNFDSSKVYGNIIEKNKDPFSFVDDLLKKK